LKDPKILNQSLGAKTWWLRLKSQKALGRKVWKEKYMPGIFDSLLILMGGGIEGSHLWNSA